MTLLCFVTCKSAREAKKISKVLLEKRLIACASLLPKIESHYRWKGALAKGTETMLILKTRKGLEKKVSKTILDLHSYELPVIEFVDAKASEKVEKWIEKETR